MRKTPAEQIAKYRSLIAEADGAGAKSSGINEDHLDDLTNERIKQIQARFPEGARVTVDVPDSKGGSGNYLNGTVETHSGQWTWVRLDSGARYKVREGGEDGYNNKTLDEDQDPGNEAEAPTISEFLSQFFNELEQHVGQLSEDELKALNVTPAFQGQGALNEADAKKLVMGLMRGLWSVSIKLAKLFSATVVKYVSGLFAGMGVAQLFGQIFGALGLKVGNLPVLLTSILKGLGVTLKVGGGLVGGLVTTVLAIIIFGMFFFFSKKGLETVNRNTTESGPLDWAKSAIHFFKQKIGLGGGGGGKKRR